MASDPAKYDSDVNVHGNLWSEPAQLEGWHKNGKREQAILDLVLKSKACTPSVYQ